MTGRRIVHEVVVAVVGTGRVVDARGVARVVGAGPPGALVVDRREPGLAHALVVPHAAAVVVGDAVAGVAVGPVADRVVQALEGVVSTHPALVPVRAIDG